MSVTGETGGLDPDVEAMLEEKNQLITRQYTEIERLQRELNEVIAERDGLLCEVSKFKFELEMADLKRLHDDRRVSSTSSQNNLTRFISQNFLRKLCTTFKIILTVLCYYIN